MARHSSLSERFLYPALRVWVPGGEPLAEQGRRGLVDIARTLKDLAARDARGHDRTPLVAVLTEQVRGHIREEERQLIPALAAAVTWHVLEDLGDRMRAARQAGAPATESAARRP